MTISTSTAVREAHARARANQPTMRLRVNSGLSGLFGSGFVATAIMAGLDVAPWWAMGVVAALLAVAEVLAQMFSKGPLTPSQEERLAQAAEELDAEANPEPTTEQVQLAEMRGDVRALADRLDRLIEHRDLEAHAAQVAAQPDPVDALRAEAEATLGGR